MESSSGRGRQSRQTSPGQNSLSSLIACITSIMFGISPRANFSNSSSIVQSHLPLAILRNDLRIQVSSSYHIQSRFIICPFQKNFFSLVSLWGKKLSMKPVISSGRHACKRSDRVCRVVFARWHEFADDPMFCDDRAVLRVVVSLIGGVTTGVVL